MIFYQICGTLWLAYGVLATYSSWFEREEKFWHAVEAWTQAVCTVPSTKTITLHGIFTDSKSDTVNRFFDALLRGIGIYCEAVIVSKVYHTGNRDGGIEDQKNTDRATRWKENWDKYKAGGEVKRVSIWRSVSSMNRQLNLRNVNKISKANHRYQIDMWNINIIFIEDSGSFEEFLEYENPFEWTRREHYIVLAVWNESLQMSNQERTIDRILRKLWFEHGIQNVFVNEPLSDDADHLMQTYNPFAKVNETTWGKSETIEIESKKHMFHLLSDLTYERTKNLHGYPVNVSVFKQPQSIVRIPEESRSDSIYNYSGGYGGMDGTILGTIAKYMNFKVRLVQPRDRTKFGHQLENGTFTGALGDIVYGRADICFVSFFVKKYAEDTSMIEFTSQVDFDKLCVMVPKARKIPKGIRIYHIFQPSVWVFIVLSQTMMHIFWHFIQTYTPPRVKKIKWMESMYKSFLVNAAYPIKLPTTDSERILLAGVFLSSMTIMGTFNGVLYQSFAKNMYYKDIDTLVDLDRSGLPVIFSSPSVNDVFGTEDDPDLPHLTKLRQKLTYGRLSLATVAFDRNVSALVREHSYPLIRESLLDTDHSHTVHLARQCPAMYYLSYLLPRNSLLRERVNILIGRLNQAGLTTMWRRIVLENEAKKINVPLYDHDHGNDGFIPFSLSDTQTSFAMLIMGLVLSVILFCIEMSWFGKCFARNPKWQVNRYFNRYNPKTQKNYRLFKEKR